MTLDKATKCCTKFNLVLIQGAQRRQSKKKKTNKQKKQKENTEL
jgi:hypothetical protein